MNEGEDDFSKRRRHERSLDEETPFEGKDDLPILKIPEGKSWHSNLSRHKLISLKKGLISLEKGGYSSRSKESRSSKTLGKETSSAITETLIEFGQSLVSSDKMAFFEKVAREHELYEAIQEKLLKFDSGDVKLIVDNLTKALSFLSSGGHQVFSDEMKEVITDFANRGLVVEVLQTSTIEDVLDEIIGKGSLKQSAILQQIKNSEFRFVTPDKPKLSACISEALSIVYSQATAFNFTVQEKGREKLKENADDFAIRMYPIVKKLQAEEKISSFRATVESLNKNQIPSYRGGEWHVNTYQNLAKRWKKLGLDKEP